MKKRILKALSLCMAITILIESAPAQAKTPSIDLYDGDPFEEEVRIRCTCYIDSGTTATGCQTRHGIIAGSPEWYGCVAILWSIDPETGEYDEFLGYYEVLDTGAGFDTDGDGKGDSLKNGQSIDVWCESLDEAKAWINKNGDYVLMKLVRAYG